MSENPEKENRVFTFTPQLARETGAVAVIVVALIMALIVMMALMMMALMIVALVFSVAGGWSLNTRTCLKDKHGSRHPLIDPSVRNRRMSEDVSG